MEKIISKLDNTVVRDFINEPYGSLYNINKSDRERIYKRLVRILRNVDSGTSIQVLLTLIIQIFSIPPNKPGCIVECGCFKGASTAALSIAAYLTNRKLYVYDSFEGLPNAETDQKRIYPHLKIYGYYKKGMYKAQLEEVKNNIKLFGELSQTFFIKGFFENTLQQHKDEIVFLFLDVDLSSSTKTCIKNLWPKVSDNSYIFTDDACDLDVAKVWFNDEWWAKELNQISPGYIGTGCGLPISGKFSSLGYSIKKLDEELLGKVKWLNY